MVERRFRFPLKWSPRSVPQIAAEINGAHPLSSGMVACYIPGSPMGPRDLCGIGPTLTPATSVSGTSYGISPVGQGVVWQGLNSANVLPAQWQFSTRMSAHYLGYLPGGSNLCDPLAISPFNSDATPFRFLLNGSGDNRIRINGTDFSLGTVNAGMNSITASVIYAGAINGYLNGTSVISSTAPAAPSYSGCGLNMGYYTGNVNSSSTHVHLLAMLWNRVLSANEARWLNAEPFAMLRPVVRRLYSVPVAAGNYAVSVTETTTATDTPSASMAASASLIETTAASDTPSASMAAAASLTETATATDTPSAAAAAAASLTETSTAQDVVSALAAFTVSVTETTAAVDSISASLGTVTYYVSITETTTASDTASVVGHFSASATESAAMADAIAMTILGQGRPFLIIWL